MEEENKPTLPKNLLYKNAINAAYSRNFNNNIAPQNGTGPYKPGETIIFNIPTGLSSVMSGADSMCKLSLKAKNGITASPFLRLDKAGIHSIIQRVRIFHGSTLLSDIDNYNNLVGMLTTLQQSGDATHGKGSILTGLESGLVNHSTQYISYPSITGERLNGYATLGAGALTAERTYCFPLLNFLSYSDKYIPLFALTGAPIRIEIQLVSNPLRALNSSEILDVNEPLIINKVEYICNFMEISDTGMNIINNNLKGMPLQWVVQDYKNYSHPCNILPSVELSVPIPAKFKSLRSLFFSFRTNVDGALKFFSLDSCHYDLDSYTVRIGSQTMPTRAPSTMAEFFAELLRAIGSVSDLNHSPNISMNTYARKEPAANTEDADTADESSLGTTFYVGLDLESYSSSGMDNVYQGLNTTTSDIFFTPRFKGSAPTVGATIDTYALFDQIVVIENGYARVDF